MFQFNNVSKQLGSFVMKDINFELPDGYIMGLVGPNGSGKTTLIRLLLGLYASNSGEIIVNGMDIKEHEKETKNLCGYVLGEELFFPELTLLENAKTFGKYYSEFSKSVLLSYINRFELSHDRKYGKLSKGEKLKFSLAFALSYSPKLLILDEPTANFDPEFRKDLNGILTDYVSDGTRSVLIATHLTDDLDRIADYITFINDGNLVFSMTKEDMTDRFKVVSGENYKIKMIKPEQIIYSESETYLTKALIRYRHFQELDREITVTNPTVEDIIYYMVKGGVKHDVYGLSRLQS